MKMMPSPLQYVVLRHENIDEPHFDLMFETTPNGPLATWRCDSWPIREASSLIRLDNHRREYLTFEGLLTANRGIVRRVEAGTFVRKATSTGQIVLDLQVGASRSVIELTPDPRGEPYWMGRRANH